MSPPTTPVRPGRLQLIRSSFFARLLLARPPDDLPGPLRGELLGADRLAERARDLACTQTLTDEDRRERDPALLARLKETRRILKSAHARLNEGVRSGVDIGPAGTWLLENFHIVEDHILEVHQSLPAGYYRQLPELSSGPLAGYPRIYQLATALISHTDGRIDLDNVGLFVGAFQEVQPLTIGELWAIPAMLRLGLLESVRRMSLRTIQGLEQMEEADRRANQLQAAGAHAQRDLDTALEDFIAKPPRLTSAFVSRLLHRLREPRAAFPALIGLERWIADTGLSGEDAAAVSAQRMALTQIVMANSITSLRVIARLDWKSLVEAQSAIEAVLHGDPAGSYASMTFGTRDHYRHVVERIAKRTGSEEPTIARMAITLAARGRAGDRESHVGYYLIDDGLAELQRQAGYRPRLGEWAHRLVLRHPNGLFIGGILIGTAAALAVLFWLAGPLYGSTAALACAIALLPALDIAIGSLNQLIAAYLPPRLLPKLDLSGPDGIPPEFRTAVVIPNLFADVDAVREALSTLEVQFLANREAHLHFAVLSDFTDAATETRPDDDAIVRAAAAGVAELNARYAPESNDAFYLFHRARQWNPNQGVWMGWERKRGKLGEFNRFLRGGSHAAFSVIVGNVEPLQHVRYVITLDADTVLPPDAAPLLVGALAHPLNRAVYDRTRQRVVRGYGILQPRVGVSLPSAFHSPFASIHSGHPGVDPYTTAVSDLYQDLYGEGSFTGKGIYDVDAFEQATHGRFPENTLLSHDLIEGSFARAGLATDIIVYDDYPTRYLTHAKRKHRWIRGDWQLLGWLTARVPGPDGPEPNRLSLLSRWKIFDNLRRSLVELAQLAFLLAAWTILPGSLVRWTMLAVGAVAAPWIVSLLLALLRPPLDKSWRAYYSAVGRDALTSAQQVCLALAFLPHHAWVSADAIARTLWRVLVSRRSLLEWQSASAAERTSAGSAAGTWRAMGWVTLGVAALGGLVITAALLGSPDPVARLAALAPAALPLFALWLTAPALAHALSARAAPGIQELGAARRAQALRYALRHWRFFDRFVGERTHGLAPDNHQEDPEPVTAMRTSPTNIGLQLLATVSACDLGFITVADMTGRLESAFRSLERMERFHGHFYNWYDLHDLRVLHPAYVSTVDSGNLAGHLIALRQACLAIRDRPPAPPLWPVLEAGLALASDDLDRRGDADLGSVARDLVGRARGMVDDAAGSDDPPAPTLADIAVPLHAALRALVASGAAPVGTASGDGPDGGWIRWCLELIERRAEELEGLESRLEALADRAYAYALDMDFRFLYDTDRELFTIGYQPDAHLPDASYYDLLASESRLASFVAIAKNDVPVDHWFHLGRSLNRAAGATSLVSWSGSMFEYLMPALVMRSFPATLLDQTHRAAVQRQIAYGAARGVPWGMSESAYGVRDRHATYQYRAFGVPDMGLKRGLDRELVVAPYASALAVMVEPQRALANLALLEGKGALGAYGFYDALDYIRPTPGARFGLVRTYMAHHVGMAFVALTNALCDRVWQERFHADPLVRSAELLLHERVPRRLVMQKPAHAPTVAAPLDSEADLPSVREIATPDTAEPHVGLLGHLPYTIMVSHCGGGYSRFENLAVTRWRPDATRDDTGQFCFLKEIADRRVWSAAHQPLCAPADWYRALMANDRITFHRGDGAIETRTEIAVVPQDAAEIRRVTVTNNGSKTREVELTSYGEVVLAPPAAERAHPAFANLFVETEFHPWCAGITATRRPRSHAERSLVCVHVVATGKERIGDVSCETDRARFLGRGRTARDPLALELDGPLSGTTGAVLDPIFALRTRVRLRPGQSACVAFTTLVAETQEKAFALADRYHNPYAAQRALDLAWTSTQVELRELGIAPSEAAVFQRIAGRLLYPSLTATDGADRHDEDRGSQPLLWSMGVSGDRPIVLATIGSLDGLPTLRQLFTAHHYWRRRGLQVDLVVLDERAPSYLNEMSDAVHTTLSATSDAGVLHQPGGVFVRGAADLAPELLRMLRGTACLLVACDGRSLGRIVEPAAEIASVTPAESPPPPPTALRRAERQRSRPSYGAGRGRAPDRIRAAAGRSSTAGAGSAQRAPSERHTTEALLFDNGIGGLDGRSDYRMRIGGDRLPPAPWANVIANPHGGFVVTERGAGFTWAESSYFFRLTPWHNDAVCDPHGEVLYLTDRESGGSWSPTPGPMDGVGDYSVRHGAGSSSFAHVREGIATELTLGMAESDAVKIARLTITNHDMTARSLTLTSYVEWTLGVLREQSQAHVRTAFHPELDAISARNAFDPDFSEWVAFHALSEPVTAHSGDRREFIGRNGSLRAPAGLGGGPGGVPSGMLSGATGKGLDPCAALQCEIELAPGETREVVILLGAAPDWTEAVRALARHREPALAHAALARSEASWSERLSVVTVRTPEPAFDAMVNRWSLYQSLACRIWARSGFYQSSGAYGFRDQLQDVMALVYAEPALARAHILRAASRQFPEGDVQHWWHEHSGRGVRTRCSDDLAWLPYVAEHYARVTGDVAILDEEVPFLAMRLLEPHEDEIYDISHESAERATLYEHCLRALRKASTRGIRGLPLIGSCDWNDGMNRVGHEGRGESVWLAWFLADTLTRFADVAAGRADPETASAMRAQAASYVAAVEENGWDGEWYRRAYFDDGTPLGSAASDECRIDAIAQSWSVISRAGRPDRQALAMRSLEDHLVREDARIIQLLAPPFDHSATDPGYIKGYLPGVRENGAQYTHAALWTVLATALRGDADRAFKLLQMLNPLTHTATPAQAATYRVEPYVVAADVYTAAGHLGRGGWTWYTGSASWFYRVGLETILGFTKQGDSLLIEPRVPASWPGFGIEYRFGRSRYQIEVERGSTAGSKGDVVLDGAVLPGRAIPLVDDGATHTVRVRLP